MRRALLAALIAGLLAAPSALASQTWYWSVARAEARLTKHGAVVEVYGCRGYGQGLRRQGEPAIWRRFLCEVELSSGKASAAMQVTGKGRYRVSFASPDPAPS